MRWATYARALILMFALWVASRLLAESGIQPNDPILAFLTAIATMAAAGAALWSAYLLSQTVRQQNERDWELKQPNLVVSGLEIYDLAFEHFEDEGRYAGKFGFDAELTNLGQFPIYVIKVFSENPSSYFMSGHVRKLDEEGNLSFEDDTTYINSYDWLGHGFLIPSNVSVKTKFAITSPIPNPHEVEGQVQVTWMKVAFQYGPTAKQIYHLKLDVYLQIYDEDDSVVGCIEVGNEDDRYQLDFSIGEYHDAPAGYITPNMREEMEWRKKLEEQEDQF